MRPRFLIFLTALAAILAACGAGDETSSTQANVRTVSVTMTDALRFDPDEFSFAAGETVRFEVTNVGATVHEFLIGDQASQAEFAQEMADDHGKGHDSDAGVSVDPGETEAFMYTFDAGGELLAGCHEPGHYEGGMVAAITVEG